MTLPRRVDRPGRAARAARALVGAVVVLGLAGSPAAQAQAQAPLHTQPPNRMQAQARAAGDPVAGRAAFAPCASCHAVGPSARSGFGPPLNDVFGRRAGSVPGYAYSAAMKQAGFVWTDARLAAFVRDPGGTVPGTSMRFFGRGYGDRRMANLIAFLRTQTAGPACGTAAGTAC